MVAAVPAYVPGYRLIKPPVIEEGPFGTPGGPVPQPVVILIEVEGRDYLPLTPQQDIMTSPRSGWPRPGPSGWRGWRRDRPRRRLARAATASPRGPSG